MKLAHLPLEVTRGPACRDRSRFALFLITAAVAAFFVGSIGIGILLTQQSS